MPGAAPIRLLVGTCEREVGDGVRVNPALDHRLQPMLGNRCLTGLHVRVDEAVEGDLAGLQAGRLELLEPLPRSHRVPASSASMQNGIVADEVRGQAAARHLQHVVLNSPDVADLGTGIHHGPECDLVHTATDFPHVVEPKLRLLDRPPLGASTDHDVVGLLVRNKISIAHSLQKLLGLGRLTRLRASVDQGVVDDSVRCLPGVDHLRKPRLRLRQVPRL
mmetsp:Transcript_57641/g.161688  ORF Transcript_57641/g.161688 Transcript_57641/m.161688 type:complete len:220 (-) Transcript_57641:391-1050(-)